MSHFQHDHPYLRSAWLSWLLGGPPPDHHRRHHTLLRLTRAPHTASPPNTLTGKKKQKKNAHSQPKILVCQGLKVFSLPVSQHPYLAAAAALAIPGHGAIVRSRQQTAGRVPSYLGWRGPESRWFVEQTAAWPMSSVRGEGGENKINRWMRIKNKSFAGECHERKKRGGKKWLEMI